MDEAAEIRIAFDKHVYWSQLDPRSHHFYKIMKFFRIELRLPKKFVMRFPVKLGTVVNLTGPIGDVIREVKVVETEEDVVLREGWGEFVNDHQLNEEDLIVFHYIGNKTFDVLLFDRTGCEKDLRFIEDEFEIKPHFSIKITNLDIKSKLMIPSKLVTKFPEKLVGKICLKGPSGNVWQVRADWSDSEDVFLGKGWKEFVSDHNLDMSDLLVFRYTGDSCYNVLVFDKTGCEKESSHFIKPGDRSSERAKGKRVSEGSDYEEDVDEAGKKWKECIKKRNVKKSGMNSKEVRHRRLPKEVTLAQLNEMKINHNHKQCRRA